MSGFFPLNSAQDFLSINVFRYGLPHSFLRSFGTFYSRLLINIFVKLFSIQIDGVLLEYWYALQTNPAMRSHEICIKFLSFFINYSITWSDGFYFNIHSYGHSLLLPTILNMTEFPVSLVYGIRDTIAPTHQGK